MKYFLVFIVIFGLTTAVQAQSSENEDLLRKYKDEVRANPNSAEAWYKFGEVDRHTFTRKAAKAAFEKAIELKPNFAGAYNGQELLRSEQVSI